MCTVTLVPFQDRGETRLRIAFNRDESINRPLGLPPQVRSFGKHSAILPIDPASDGTWIAVNDSGLVAAILNRNPQNRSDNAATMSRGTIVPSLLHCEDLASAERLALDLNGHCFSPFRLVLADRTQFAMIEGGGEPTVLAVHGLLAQPQMFTSSGLGDHLVEEPRRELFEQLVLGTANENRQWEFHRHSWPDRQHLSVCMRRRSAHTVSLTTIDLTATAAELTYYPQPPDELGPSITLSILLQSPTNS